VWSGGKGDFPKKKRRGRKGKLERGNSRIKRHIPKKGGKRDYSRT